MTINDLKTIYKWGVTLSVSKLTKYYNSTVSMVLRDIARTLESYGIDISNPHEFDKLDLGKPYTFKDFLDGESWDNDFKYEIIQFNKEKK